MSTFAVSAAILSFVVAESVRPALAVRPLEHLARSEAASNLTQEKDLHVDSNDSHEEWLNKASSEAAARRVGNPVLDIEKMEEQANDNSLKMKGHVEQVREQAGIMKKSANTVEVALTDEDLALQNAVKAVENMQTKGRDYTKGIYSAFADAESSRIAAFEQEDKPASRRAGDGEEHMHSSDDEGSRHQSSEAGGPVESDERHQSSEAGGPVESDERHQSSEAGGPVESNERHQNSEAGGPVESSEDMPPEDQNPIIPKAKGAGARHQASSEEPPHEASGGASYEESSDGYKKSGKPPHEGSSHRGEWVNSAEAPHETPHKSELPEQHTQRTTQVHHDSSEGGPE